MIRSSISIRALPLTTGAIFLLVSSRLIFAQAPEITATVQFSNGQTLTATSFSENIAIQPSEIANVTIQFSAQDSGQPVHVATLDGGQIVSGASGVVNNDGKVSFSFRAPSDAGEIRIAIRKGTKKLRMEFWVPSSNPNNNPPVVTPANPEG